MEPIYIPQLAKAPDQTETLQVHQYIHDLETLTPAQGKLTVTHCGQYLKVAASVETIITLTCDRCLQNYNQRLVVDASELIWLNEISEIYEDDVLERELVADDLIETLPPTGYFNPEVWLYEYLCLSLPQQQLCDQSCAGIQVAQTEDSEQLQSIDSRWASLAALKGQLLN